MKNSPFKSRQFFDLVDQLDKFFTAPSINAYKVQFLKNIDVYPPPFQIALIGNISINCQEHWHRSLYE